MFFSKLRKSWARRVLASTSIRSQRCKVQARQRLLLEPLEDRMLLSATITDLGVLPGGATSFAYGINDSGQVVGESGASSGAGHAFLYNNGQMTDLGTLSEEQFSAAYGINDSGQVVGKSSTINGVGHAFLYSNGQMTDLGTLPGGHNSTATAINDSGQVIGYSILASNGYDPFLYSKGQMADLGALPGGVINHAYGINDSGQVVGSSTTFSDGTHPFLYSNGQMIDLGTLPGGDSSPVNAYASASAINDSGQVVGTSTIEGGDRHAFLYSKDQMTDLGTLPGSQHSEATGINDSGQVVGNSYIDGGDNHAFLYSNGQMTDLNSLLPAHSGWFLESATGINDNGQIVGYGGINGLIHAFLLNLNPDNSSPIIIDNPIGQTVTAGQSVTFTVSASGDPTPTVQWKVNTGDGSGFNDLSDGDNVSGATTTTLTLSNVTTAMSGYQYEAKFQNNTGKATTDAATLTVNAATTAPPSIISPPSNQTATAGQSVSFTALASDAIGVVWQVYTNSNPSWQDLLDGPNVSGANSTTLTLSNVTTSMNGNQYRADFYGSASPDAITSAATLTVNASPPAPPSPPSPPAPPAVPVLNAPPQLAFFNSLFGAIEVVNADGSVTETASFFGIPLLVSNFDSSGHLVSISLFGFDVTFWFLFL